MSRVTGGTSAHARHRKVIKKAKGYYGRRKNTFRAANQAVERAGQYAYRDRRNRKRVFRSLVDSAHQRGRPRARLDLWPLH